MQLAVSSVIRGTGVAAKHVLLSNDYNGDQVRVEPTFSPTTESERRAVYETEAPFVKNFEYADLPSYAIVTVGDGTVSATVYRGTTREVWKRIKLSDLLFG